MAAWIRILIPKANPGGLKRAKKEGKNTQKADN
jgi:hypothetical protein